MKLVLISDAQSALSARIVIRSVLRTNTPHTIFVVDAGLAPGQETAFRALSDTVEIVAVPDALRQWCAEFSLHGHAHVSAAAFLKLRLHDLLPDLDRIIYLDTDVVVLHDLQPLFDLPLGDCLVGATWNLSQALRGSARLGLAGDYFNSGVMVCPLGRWRAESVELRFMEWYRLFRHLMQFNDQEVLNGVFNERVKWIGKQWNVSHTEIFHVHNRSWMNLQLADCRVLHFNGAPKPWQPGFERRAWLSPADHARIMQMVASLVDPGSAPWVAPDPAPVAALPDKVPAALSFPQRELALCTLVDEFYSHGLAALLKSLRVSNPAVDLPFLVYSCGPLSDAARARISREYPRIEFRQIDPRPYTRCQFSEVRMWDMNPAFRYELFLHNEYEQLVYLDADMLILGDISPLLAFRGALGASPWPLSEGLELRGKEGFNAGMLSLGRAIRTREVWMSLLALAESKPWSGNQSVLNLVLRPHWQRLPVEFNMLTTHVTLENLASVRIVHFVGKRKPWEQDEPIGEYQRRLAGPAVCARLMDIWGRFAPSG